MPINSGVLSFGLVSIPVRLYPAIKDQTIRFHLLHKKCGTRVRNQWFCPVCNEVVDRENLVRGFEVSKGEYVRLTEQELDSIEAEANKNIDLKEFVPISSVDPIYFESSYYLGPDKGGEKPHRLLADALAKSGRAAVAELVSRGKEQIVIIRPYDGGLILHGMFYQNEVRDFSEIPRGDSQRPKQEELKLGAGLIDQMSNGRFDLEKYHDEYRLRMQGLLDEKVKGHEITAAPQAPQRREPVIDLLEALKRSINREAAPAKAKAAAGRKTQKAKKAG